MEELILVAYIVCLSVLFLFGSHGFIMIYYHIKFRHHRRLDVGQMASYPTVTVQLPVYNELYVVGRLIDAACAIVYPKDKLEIQVLDDSTDDTVGVVDEIVARYREQGYDIKHVRRGSRAGFKAGALKAGLEVASGEFVAIFDADFIPRPDFLLKTIPHLRERPRRRHGPDPVGAPERGLLAPDAHAGDGPRRPFRDRAVGAQQGGTLHQLQRHGGHLAAGRASKTPGTGRPTR